MTPHETATGARSDEELFRQLAENVEHVFWIANIEGTRCFYLSPAYRIVYGRHPEEVYRDFGSWVRSVHEDDRVRVLESLKDLYRRRQGYEIEYRIRRPDGEVRWIHVRSFPVRSGAGSHEIDRVAGVAEDITARKRTEDALTAAARANARFAAALENLTTGVIITDPQQHDDPIIYTNPGFTAMTGYAEHEVLGRNPRFLQGPGTDPEVVRQIRTTIAERRAFKGRLLNYRRDGSPFWNELTISPVVDALGGVVSYVGLQSDVTDRVRSEEQIAQQLREKTVLLQEVHHRVKNNLQIISSLLNLQIRALRDPLAIRALQESRSRIQAIAVAHEALYRSRSVGRVDLADYIRNLARQLQRSHFVERRIELTLEMDECLLHLSQAVLCGLLTTELLTNAFKHAFPGDRAGTVAVRVRSTSDACTIAVADDGAGMPREAARGGGIGLQLVRDLAHQLHASLDIRTEVGTEFRITFKPTGEAA